MTLKDAPDRLPPTPWAPMETAPKNPAGTYGHRGDLDIDLWHTSGRRYADCFWWEEKGAWFVRSGGRAYNAGRDADFTHWMRPGTPADAEPVAEAAVEAFINSAPRWMLNAQIFPDRHLYLKDWIDTPEEDEARELGVVFANGKGYAVHSDLRGDEIDDATSEILRRGMRHARTEMRRWAARRKPA